ncbi:hypothetical protein HN592_02085 [Candidatus Woesearchaeota archaeon]|jgi:tRNA threonylcarbamoyladenosine modification (KEOPS) complex  Pcc1 subunit|nr:hypothetical protein [Candidatus Woesearchaeota archaeon]MBT4368002.1 hypothetical protein [Candidatus Woesearchaeota archaeon]MBT4712490.1 hypothetical protein [Candidatus Woesearchaeota archaeon]MBT6639403.1 hypothetical protein [Candidatus Woesearchaeota archaeon]MBT7133575.1 hypothetical protein [Candidatus Woesearchaeota archaeon]
MISAIITIDENVEELYKAIQPEIRKQLRSTIEIEKTDKLTFKIEANDAVALRATLNSLTQMLSVFHKVKEIQ